jgi:hypothetical protein
LPYGGAIAGRGGRRGDRTAVAAEASPRLNPMDQLWRYGKERMSRSHQYASIEEQVDRFIGYLAGLSAYEALKNAGTFSKDFWLRP